MSHGYLLVWARISVEFQFKAYLLQSDEAFIRIFDSILFEQLPPDSH